MTKAASGGMVTHLAGSVSTLAMCVKITRRDAEVFAFTTHTSDLVISSVTYVAAQGSFSPQMVKSSADMSVDNLDIEAIIDSSYITDADLLAGLFDYATVELFMVNYMALGDGIVRLRRGTLGEIESRGYTFRGELRGLMQSLQQVVGRVYAKRCDADLGDARCGVSLGAHTVASSVTSVASKQQFNGAAIPGRPYGLLTWTSGNNNGLKMEIRTVSVNTIVLVQPMPFTIQVSDTFSAYAGCDKLPDTCRSVFSNIINFRGYPFIPGNDRALQYPDAK